MKVIVIGAGAAGIMAAITSEKCGNETIIIEKNSSIGNKIKITGKGRCNLTFDGDLEDFKRNIVKNYKFMYSSFNNFSNKDIVDYVEKLGVKTKVERGGRVFPASDNATDIVKAFEKELKKHNVKIMFNSTVKKLNIENNKITGITLGDGRIIDCDKCIVTTGGKSYPKTGSTGDGYILAKNAGHDIIKILPGLVPLMSKDNVCKKLQGLSLKNVSYRLYDDKKEIYSDFGELMFSHFGLTGPVVLSSSSKLNRIENVYEKLEKGKIVASIDLKPALDENILDKRICRDFEKFANKEFKNSLDELLPKKLIPIIIEKSGINEDKKVHQITKEERKNLVDMLKNFKIVISGFMPIDIAIVTCGGVDVSKVNPKTMESKIVSGLFFAGEVLDIDAYTGGFNLQIAFSTGVAAGKN